MRKTPLQELIDKNAPTPALLERTARLMARVPGAEDPARAKVRRIHPERPAKRRALRLRPALALSLALALLIGGAAVYGRIWAARPDDHVQPLSAGQSASPENDGSRSSTPGEPSPTGNVQSSTAAEPTLVGEAALSPADASATSGGAEGLSHTENGLTLTIERFSAVGAELACDYTVSSGRDEMVYYLVEGLIEPSAATDFDYGHPISGSARGTYVFLNSFLFIGLDELTPEGEAREEGFQYAYANALPEVPATLRLAVRAFVFAEDPQGGVGASDLFTDTYSGGPLPCFQGTRDGAFFTHTLVAPAYVDTLARLQEEEPEPSSREDLALYLRALTESGLFYEIEGPTLELSIGPQVQSETVSVAEKSYFLSERFVVVHSLEVSRYSLRMRYDVHTKIPYDTAEDRNCLFPFYYPLTPEGEPLYTSWPRYGWGASRSEKGYISFENSSIDRALDLDAIPEYLVFVPLDADKVDQEKAAALTEQGLSNDEGTRVLLRDIATEYPEECFIVPLTIENAPRLPEGWPFAASTPSEPTAVSLQRDYHAMFNSTLSEPRERLLIRDQWVETAEERVYIEEMQVDDFGLRGAFHRYTEQPYTDASRRNEGLVNYRPFTPDGQLIGTGLPLQAAYTPCQEDDGTLRVVVAFNINYPFAELPDSLIFVPCPRLVSGLLPEGTPDEDMEAALAAALWRIWEDTPEKCFTVPLREQTARVADFTLEGFRAGSRKINAHFKLRSTSSDPLFYVIDEWIEPGEGNTFDYSQIVSDYPAVPSPVYSAESNPFQPELGRISSGLGRLDFLELNYASPLPDAPATLHAVVHYYAFNGDLSALDGYTAPAQEDEPGVRMYIEGENGSPLLLESPEYAQALEELLGDGYVFRPEAVTHEVRLAYLRALTRSGLFTELDTGEFTVSIEE